MKGYLIRRSKYFCSQVKFASIDIGKQNFAIVWGYSDPEYNKVVFKSFTLINFDKVEAQEKSGVQQYNHISDKLKTYFEIENKDIFDDTEMIFVEYQPPQGLRIIQEYLVTTFKHKVIFVHPQQMHKFFRADCYCYIQRKDYMNYRATEFMSFEFFEEWDKLKRKHDVSDAICLAYYYIYVNGQQPSIGRKRKIKKKKGKKKIKHS